MRFLWCVFALGCATGPSELASTAPELPASLCDEAHATIDGWLDASMLEDQTFEVAVLDALRALRVHEAEHADHPAPSALAEQHLAGVVEPLQHISLLAEHRARTSGGEEATQVAKESRALLASISPELDPGPWNEDGC